MWISRRIIAAEKRKPAARLAQVTGAALKGESEYRGVPLCLPWGVAARPPAAARAAVVETDGGYACIGVLADTAGLESGEVRLCSAGGAEIVLKNSGEVVINGQVFAAKEG